MIQKRRVLMGMQNRSLLPKEYQQVEWIQTPSQNIARNTYILTAIANANIASVVCRYKVLNPPGYTPIIIASYAPGSDNPLAPWASIGGHKNGVVSIAPTYTAPYNDILDTFSITYPVGAQNYLRIGGWSDNAWTAEGAYYFVTVVGTDNTEIAKFIPCYRKSDNVAGFYDIIRNGFYPSNGTIDYIAGPSI